MTDWSNNELYFFMARCKNLEEQINFLEARLVMKQNEINEADEIHFDEIAAIKGNVSFDININ